MFFFHDKKERKNLATSMLSARCWHLTLKARALPGPDANHAYTPLADVASKRSSLK
jgi:hypothetical protein